MEPHREGRRPSNKVICCPVSLVIRSFSAVQVPGGYEGELLASPKKPETELPIKLSACRDWCGAAGFSVSPCRVKKKGEKLTKRRQ